jgi:hypothetical protein
VARIRSIKPELRTSVTVSMWPREVRYLFILLWGYLDDYGRGVDDELLIASDCFPRDRDITPEIVSEWLEMIADSGPLCRYEVDGRPYLHCPNWREHQKPSHPTRSKIPPCPDDEPGDFEVWRKEHPERFVKRSRKSRETLRNSPGPLPVTSEARSGALWAPSEAASEAHEADAPPSTADEDEQDPEDDEGAGQNTLWAVPESLANPSGNPPEHFVPEQGSKGAREQGSKGGGRAGGRELVAVPPLPPARSRPDGRHPIPEDFALTDGMRRWATTTVPGLDPDYETAQFIDHYRDDGTRKTNWNTEWQIWMRRSAKWASEDALKTKSRRRPPFQNPTDENAYDEELG